MTNSRVGLFVPAPSAQVIWTGTADGAQTSDFVLTVSDVTGVLAARMDGLVLYNAAGEFTRIRSVSGQDIQLAENYIVFAASDPLTIYNIRLPFSRAQRVTDAGAVFKDWDVAFPGDYRDAMPPAPCVTPETAWVPIGGQIEFDADLSVATEPDSLALTVTWTVEAGATVLSETSDARITNRYATIEFTQAGIQYVRATVTDDISGAASVRSVIIYVAISAIEVISLSRQWSLDKGWSTRATASAEFEYLDHSPATIIDLETLEILANGFISPNQVRRTFGTETFSFDILSALRDSEKLTTYPFTVQEVTGVADPATWAEMKEPTLIRTLWFLLYWHSMLPEVSNVVLEDPLSRRIKGQRFPGGNLPNALKSIVSSAFRVLRSEATGGMIVRLNPLYDSSWASGYTTFDLTDPANRVETYTLAKDRDAFSEVFMSGVYLDSGGDYEPARVRAPRNPAMWGGSGATSSNKAPLDLAEISGWAARHYIINNTVDTLSVSPLLRVDPSTYELMSTDVPETPVICIESVSEGFNTERGYWTEEVTGRPFGVSDIEAVTVPDPPAVVIVPSPTPPPPPIPLFPPAPTPDPWPDIAYFATEDNGIYNTIDFNEEFPTWTAINAIEGGGTLSTVGVIAVSPVTGSQFAIQNRSSFGNGELYRRTGGTWTLVLDNAAAAALIGRSNVTMGYVHASANGAVWAFVGSYRYVYVLLSQDDGLTWAFLTICWKTGLYERNNTARPGTGHVTVDDVLYASGLFTGANEHGKVGWNAEIGSGTVKMADVSKGNQFIFMYYNDYTGIPYATETIDQFANPIRRIVQVQPDTSVIYPAASENGMLDNGTFPEMVFANGSPDIYLMGAFGAYQFHLYHSDDSWATKTDLTPSGIGVTARQLRLSPSSDEDLALLRIVSGTAIDAESIWVTDDFGATPPTGKSGADPQNLLTTTSIPYDNAGAVMNSLQFYVPSE